MQPLSTTHRLMRLLRPRDLHVTEETEASGRLQSQCEAGLSRTVTMQN